MLCNVLVSDCCTMVLAVYLVQLFVMIMYVLRALIQG